MRSTDTDQSHDHLPAADHGAPATAPDTPPGWYPVEQVHLPTPTYWPAVLALAITFLAWSVLTSLLIALVGVILFALALGGWIGELLDEH